MVIEVAVINLPPSLMREECCFGEVLSNKKLPALLSHAVTVLSKGMTVVFKDFNIQKNGTMQDVEKYLSEVKPEHVVCTLTHNNLKLDARIFDVCISLGIKCIGIPIPFEYARELIYNYDLYFVIRSEPIKTLEEWAEYRDLSKVKGIIYRDQGRVVHNLPQDPCFSEIPVIEWGFIELEKYNVFVYQIASGCPYGCVFCMWANKKYQLKPVNVVLSDLEELERRGVKMVYLLCSQITTDKKWLKEFCEEKIKRKIKVLWHTDIRANELTNEVASLMRKAGCIRVFMGVESVNKERLQWLNKQLTIEQINKATKICLEEGLVSCIAFMFNIGEDEKTLEEYLDFVDQPHVQIATVGASDLYVLPGTQLAREEHVPKDTGMIKRFRRALWKRKPARVFRRVKWLLFNKNARETLMNVLKTFDLQVYKRFMIMVLRLTI